MLIKELLIEDIETNEIIDDLMDMITACINQYYTEIPMNGPSGMLLYLNKSGHYLSSSDVMTTLSRPEFKDVVKRSTPDSIQLNTAEPSGVGKPQIDKSKDKVTNDAEKEATKVVKAGAQI